MTDSCRQAPVWSGLPWECRCRSSSESHFADEGCRCWATWRTFEMSCALVTLLHPKSANIHEYSNVKESCPETKYSTHRRQVHLFFFSFVYPLVYWVYCNVLYFCFELLCIYRLLLFFPAVVPWAIKAPVKCFIVERMDKWRCDQLQNLGETLCITPSTWALAPGFWHSWK